MSVDAELVFFILLTDCGERDYLPHQEAIMKVGLEKAVQHKEKLLEYDRNRYHKNTQSHKKCLLPAGRCQHFNWTFLLL